MKRCNHRWWPVPKPRHWRVFLCPNSGLPAYGISTLAFYSGPNTGGNTMDKTLLSYQEVQDVEKVNCWTLNGKTSTFLLDWSTWIRPRVGIGRRYPSMRRQGRCWYEECGYGSKSVLTTDGCSSIWCELLTVRLEIEWRTSGSRSNLLVTGQGLRTFESMTFDTRLPAG